MEYSWAYTDLFWSAGVVTTGGANVIYLLFALASVGLNAVAQVLFKIGSRHSVGHFEIYDNPATISGYFLVLLVVICSFVALKGLELKLVYAIASLSYAVVALLSVFLLRERLTWQKVGAILLITAGVFIFHL